MRILGIKHSRGVQYLLLFFFLAETDAKAQLNPLAGIYYQNQFLANPAMAGLDSGFILNLGYRQQWSSLPGAPKTQSITGSYRVDDRVGLGVSIYNDEAGLLNTVRAMAAYSYHVPVDDKNRKLSFGISFGFQNQKVNYQEVDGDTGDQNLGRFNERELFIDADFGAAFTSKNLTLQAAIPNMKSFFKKEDKGNAMDRSLFFTALSYKFYFPYCWGGMGLEPKVSYRGVRGYENIADIGANVTVANEMVTFMTIYHTSRSVSYGMGLNYKKLVSILGIYTTETSALSNYTNGTFELAMKLNLF